jgi:hypothetical protein
MYYGFKVNQNMPKKQLTPEDIFAKLRQMDDLVLQSFANVEAVR